MEIQYLRAFVAAAREGNFTRAGERLFTAQSNISASIRNLEREWNTPLFVRTRKGARLTKKGEEFFVLAMKILNLVDEAGHLTARDRPPEGGLAFGSMESTAVVRLPSLIAGFLKKYPGIRVDLRTSDTSLQRERLNRGELECAFIGEEAEDETLSSLPVFKENMVIAVADSSPARHLSDLARSDFLVLQKGCSFRRRLETILSRRGVAGVRFHDVTGIHTQIACVNAGMGAGFFPRSFIDYHRMPGVRIIALPNSESLMHTHIVWKKDRFLSRPASIFIEYIKKRRRSG